MSRLLVLLNANTYLSVGSIYGKMYVITLPLCKVYYNTLLSQCYSYVTVVLFYSKFLEFTSVLLSCDGGNINMKTMGGFTPVMIAATNNEDDVVKFLCEYPGTPSLDLDVKVMQSICTTCVHKIHNILLLKYY